MMTQIGPKLVMALTIVLTPLPMAAQRQPITLYVPAFGGPESLGNNVATILNLQVWETLRKAPYPNPKNISFGDGLILWDDKPLPSQAPSAAVLAAHNYGADLVLWGKAWHYGNGVVVQAYLTIPAADRRSIWEVMLPGADNDMRVSIDLPPLQYEFHPIVLTRAIVDNYSSPSALKLYASPKSTDVTGFVGNAFTALEQDGSFARVESNGAQGWLHLPSLSANRSEVVDFIGGIIRVLRADWDGAQRLFQDVITIHRPQQWFVWMRTCIAPLPFSERA